MKNKILFAVSFLLLFLTSTANANLITNGGFETGDLTGWSCVDYDWCDANSSWAVRTGSYGFSGYDNSGYATLSQSISTLIGSIYDFSFFSKSTQDHVANILRYQIDGGVIQTVTRSTSWTETLTSFTATGTTTLISFLFETDSGTGTWNIDDVSVTGATVPEPTTLALMGLGLAGIGWKRRKAA